MSLSKWGLILNLIGSIFLGLHIMGIERLKQLEEKIKNLPENIGADIASEIIGPIVKAIFSYQSKRWPGGTKQWEMELKNKLEIGTKITLPPDWKKLRENRMLYQFLITILISLPFILAIHLALTPITLLLSLIINPIAIIQEKFKLQSFLGLVGIALLIIGFILQIIN